MNLLVLSKAACQLKGFPEIVRFIFLLHNKGYN